MHPSDFRSILLAAFSANGMEEFAKDDIINKLENLTEHMLAVNAVMNLTRITEPTELVLRHYVDSLTVSPYIPKGATVLDVGCGAGFPSLPLAIARPDLHITALDSTDKKVRYVNETAALLGISDRLQAVTARAEEAAAPKAPMREHFDVVTGRAVARLNILAEITLPFVRLGGRMIAMKGGQAQDELTEAVTGYRLLGASTPERIPCPILSPDGARAGDAPDEHSLIVAEKVRKTPEIYPRKYAQILKKPL